MNSSPAPELFGFKPFEDADFRALLPRGVALHNGLSALTLGPHVLSRDLAGLELARRLLERGLAREPVAAAALRLVIAELKGLGDLPERI